MNKRTIYDKSLKPRSEMNLSTFSFLFSEIINYYLTSKTLDIEADLMSLGESIGPRVLELVNMREKNFKREKKHLEMIKFVAYQVWKTLFGKGIDNIERLSHSASSYLLIENSPIVLRYIPESSDKKNPTCAVFVGGIIKGILDAADFPAKIEVQSPPNDGRSVYPKTVYIVEFEDFVIQREKE